MAISEHYRWTLHLNAVADLITIAFFNLLRVGKYTSPATPREKWTIPLRMCDIRLWKQDIILPHSSGLMTLLTVDRATTCISHTKNGTKGAVVHHEAFGGPMYPVAALARHIANIQQGPQAGNLDKVYHPSCRPSKVSDQVIGVAV
jgi:hypothetical protein